MDDQEKLLLKKKKQKKLIRQGITVGSVLAFILILWLIFHKGIEDDHKDEDHHTPPCPQISWVKSINKIPIKNLKGLYDPGQIVLEYSGSVKDKTIKWSAKEVNPKKKNDKKSRKGKEFKFEASKGQEYAIQLTIKEGKCITEKYKFSIKVRNKKPEPKEPLKKPILSFEIQDGKGQAFAGDTVYFINTSENISTFKWDFGDSTFSTDKTPFHVFKNEGDYIVKLRAPKSVRPALRPIKILKKQEPVINQKVKPTSVTSTFIDWRKFPLHTLGAQYNSDCPFEFKGTKHKVKLHVKQDIQLEDFAVLAESDGTEMSISIYKNDQNNIHNAFYGSNYIVNSVESPCIVSTKISKGDYIMEIIINGEGHIGTILANNSCITQLNLNDVLIIEYPGNNIPLFNMRIKYKEN